MHPCLSILIPTFNRCQDLEHLISTFPLRLKESIELVIVDDGSDDATWEMIPNYVAMGYPIRYYKQDNQGRHAALRNALSHAKGNYTMLFDSDDYFLPYGLDLVCDYLISDFSYDCLLFPVLVSNVRNIEGVDENASNLISAYADGTKRKYDKKEVVKTSILRSASDFWKLEYRRTPTLLLWLLVTDLSSSFIAINLPIAFKNYRQDGISQNLFDNLMKNPYPMYVLYDRMSRSTHFKSKKYRFKAKVQLTRYSLHCKIFQRPHSTSLGQSFLGLLIFVCDKIRQCLQK